VDARFLTEYLEVSNIAVIHNNTEYGQGLANSLVQELAARGAQTAVQLEVEEGQAAYSTEVEQIQAANPDALFYAGYEIEAPYLRYELVEAGVDIPMLNSDGVFLAASIDEAAGAAEGMYVSAFAPSPRYIADAQWFEAYQVVEYRNPDTYSVNGYVAMQVLAEGVKHANTLASESIADALRREKLKTMLGELSYESNGNLSNPGIWVYQVVNQEFEQVDW
jgi:branched-chain amino acid transport system substrate-binding protein